MSESTFDKIEIENVENDDIEKFEKFEEFRGTDFTPIEYGEQLGYMGKYSETP